MYISPSSSSQRYTYILVLEGLKENLRNINASPCPLKDIVNPFALCMLYSLAPAKSSPIRGSDPHHAASQVTTPPKPQAYGGDHSAVIGVDVTGHQGFMQHQGGHGALSYSEDTGATMRPHANQNFNNFWQHFNIQQTTGQPYHGQGTSPPIQYASPGPIHQLPLVKHSHHRVTLLPLKP